jgi:hypothetical protein
VKPSAPLLVCLPSFRTTLNSFSITVYVPQSAEERLPGKNFAVIYSVLLCIIDNSVPLCSFIY